MYIDLTKKSKNQNLHFIRFIAAVCVLLCHSFSVSEGMIDNEVLYVISSGQLDLGLVAVCIFFLIGGLLITGSAQRAHTAKRFFTARLRRLIPPLAFVTVLVMIAGVFFTSLPAAAYFTSAKTWKYLLNSILVLVHELPGVFETNPYCATVNGSLWTLPVEMACYIACFVLYRLKATGGKSFIATLPVAAAGFAGLYFAGRYVPVLTAVFLPCLFFYIGMGFWIYRERIVLRYGAAAGLFVLLLLGIFIKAGKAAFVICFPYILMTLCFGRVQVPSGLGKLGNYSYGMYLWGFPVQQAVVHMHGSVMNPYLNFLISLPVVIALGAVMYYCIESRIHAHGSNRKP